LVDEIIETPVILFGVDKEATKSNLYGESTQKIFTSGISVNALIEHDPQETDDQEFGPDVYQSLRVAINRKSLFTVNFYPERGDYLKWNNAYYEVGIIEDNQLIAGRDYKDAETPGMSHSIIVSAHMVSADSINIRDEVL